MTFSDDRAVMLNAFAPEGALVAAPHVVVEGDTGTCYFHSLSQCRAGVPRDLVGNPIVLDICRCHIEPKAFPMIKVQANDTVHCHRRRGQSKHQRAKGWSCNGKIIGMSTWYRL